MRRRVMSNTDMKDDDQHGEEFLALDKALLDESMDPVDLPLSLLKAITRNFSEAREIGRGGFGVVYMGVLPSGTVAVKKLFERFDILDKNFESEIACLVGVKHKNIVRFLGYCSETQHVMRPYDGKLVWAEVRQRLLCFEYLPKGCLVDYLSDPSCQFQWTTRYQIIKGMCEGVHYLHQQRIIHMDLKYQNVLLDDNMVPRIADFGLSRRLSKSQSRAITQNMLGTMGYMAPEFLNNGEITFKTDIYSLGRIIMEILIGHKECSNAKEVVESWANKFGASKNHTSLEQVKVCAEIGIKCTNYEPGNRPATWFITREFKVLDELEASNWFLTNDSTTSTKGQISFVSKTMDELTLMAGFAAPPQLQPSTMEVDHGGVKVRQMRKISFASKPMDELTSMDGFATPSQLEPTMLEVEQEDGKVSQVRTVKAMTVSVATGVLSTLSGKLTTFMHNEYNKSKELTKQVSFLKKNLSTVNDALSRVEIMDELTPKVKNWIDNAREISYDMENLIDDFMHHFGDDDDEACFVGEDAELLKRFYELHQIANQMEELRNIVAESNARCEGYNEDDCKLSYGSRVVGCCLPTSYPEANHLVGIDDPREEVANWLMDHHKKLKVVSVVGIGGLGKTTLAKQVFDKIREQFDCVAFLSVSRRPDMRMLLDRLQMKLRINGPSQDCAFYDILENIRKYLAEKRYLIVVDDLWDQSTWITIGCAFPENANGSRIIVTTQVEDVASVACHNDRECIYTMKPLNEQNSRMLFSNRIFGSEIACPPHHEDIADEILKKCGGMPLAIITIASLLAIQVRSGKHWESIRKSLDAQSATNLAFTKMDSILNLSYMHLPLHLRSCFLYLGMYPKDYIIQRDDLIKQWIAEGFINSMHGTDLEDVGRSYFNQLVNRSIIQPWNSEHGVVFFTVHDMMFDLILCKCIEENFVSVAYNCEDMARLLNGAKYKVRRLSLSSMAAGGATYATTIAASLSQVRSFILFENPIPPLLWFKYLRVLIVIGRQKEAVDLTVICQLFQLRYLMARIYGKIELPTELGELLYLETLDIENCQLIKNLPSDIVHLPRLSYLILPNFIDMPNGIENMKSLHTLRGFDLKENSLECIMDLGKLTNLRELTMITNFDLETPKANALACSIGKLCNLKCMSISGSHFEDYDQQLGSLSDPFQHIEHIGLQFWLFHRVPKWMGGLHCLRVLQLYVREMSTEEVHLLGDLPSLVQLHFGVVEITDEKAILGSGLFPILELLSFLSGKDSVAYLAFEAGAMPKLRTLCLSAIHWGSTIQFGMEHLLHLQEIRVFGASNDVVSAFKEATLVHPNRPSVFST